MTGTNGNGNGARVGTDRVKQGLAQMLKGGVIVSVKKEREGRKEGRKEGHSVWSGGRRVVTWKRDECLVVTDTIQRKLLNNVTMLA